MILKVKQKLLDCNLELQYNEQYKPNKEGVALWKNILRRLKIED